MSCTTGPIDGLVLSHYDNHIMTPKDFVVILFYKFTHLANPKDFAEAHKKECARLGLVGRMIVAEEGINGTFEGTREAIEAYKSFLKKDSRFAEMTIKESKGTGLAFPNIKIKVRNEIVTLGAGAFDIAKETASELQAEELEKWYEDGEDFVVLDLRNDYEIASGRFDRTIDPGLANFRDLPKKIGQLSSLKNKKIVAVCTGGIRCEKATCLLKKEGFTNIYQLKDGIHTYMKEYPGKNFKGTLFVFDNRMTTDVVSVESKLIVGKCIYCSGNTENYYSDDSIRPSRKVLCCDACYMLKKDSLRSIR